MYQPVLPDAPEINEGTSQVPSPSASSPDVELTGTCAYCRSEIERGAEVCPKCRMYQSRWRNRLTYYGGLLGPLAICVSAAAYIFTTIANHNASNQEDAVTAIYLEYPGFQLDNENGNILLSNHGGGDIYVSDIMFEWEGGGQNNLSVLINYDIKRNFTSDVPLKTTYDETFPKDENPNGGVIISNKTGIVPEKVLVEVSKKAANRCVSPRFISTSDPQYKRISKALEVSGDKPVTIKVGAYLNTVSDRTGQQASVLLQNVVAIFGTRGEPWCRDSDWTSN